MQKIQFSNWRLFGLLGLMLAAASLASLATGQVSVPLPALLDSLFSQWGWFGFEERIATAEQAAVVWHIRLPRTLVGILVGAALAVSGAVMQGVFGNPLADPGIIGVSAGASLGAVIAINLGLSSLYTMPVFALIGALLAVLITVSLAIRQGQIPVLILLLAGVAVSMLMGALTSGILTFMNEYRLREFLFWMVGGLDYRRWDHVSLAAGPIVVGISMLCLLARHLNILALGQQEAVAVGMPVLRLRLLLLLLAAITTATAVCVSGMISFIGLLIPHIMRLIIGPEHRVLLPACAVAGGIFLVGCDTLGRLIIPPAEIRVGIITALMGAPYFLYLLRRAQKGGTLS